MQTNSDTERYRANRQDEIDSAALYRALAELEPNEQLSELYRRMSEVEERHASIWEERLQAAGYTSTPTTEASGWQSIYATATVQQRQR